jgi:polysaccharide chain length determinant protein (PEP-CTERM system associated)
MHELIAQFFSHVRNMWRHRWYAVGVAWLVCLAGWIIVYMLPNRFEASARVYVDTQSILKPLLQGLAVQPNLDQQVAMIARTLITRPNLEKVLRMADLDIKAKTGADKEGLIDMLSARMVLSSTGKDNLFAVTYWDSHPDQAKKVVQSLLTIFVESSLGDKRKDADSARRFIDEQIKAYEQKLVVAENSLKEFKQKHIGMMPDEKQNYYNRLSDGAGRLNQAQLELREAENARDAIKAQIAGEEPMLLGEESSAEPEKEVKLDPELEDRIQTLQKNLDSLRLRFTERHPDIVSTKRILAQLQDQKEKAVQEAKMSDEIEQAKRAQEGKASADKNAAANAAKRHNANPVFQQLKVALSESEASVAAIKARVREFETRLSDLKAMANMVPQVEAELSQLNRDYEVNKANYEKLLARRESAQISGEMESSAGGLDFRVIDPPRVPSAPSGPNRPLLDSLVLLGGVFGGLALAFIMSQIRPTFNDRQGLREFTGLPLLGSVSMIWTSEQRRKSRQKTLAYALSCFGLICAYGLIIAVSLLRDEDLINKVRSLANL